MARRSQKIRQAGRVVSAGDLSLSDLNILIEIYRGGRLSDAVDKVGLSQPSVSLRLARLREHFNDPLFTRNRAGMLPTPRMKGLIASLRQAAGLIEEALSQNHLFDPRSSDRMFRLCLTDMGQLLVLPGLLAKLQEDAPGCKLEVLNFDGSTPGALESGAADLAVGALRFDPPPLLRRQQLIETDFVCVCRQSHPRVGERITKAEYLKESHVAVIYPGRAEAAFDRMLNKAEIARKVVATVPSSVAVGEIIESSDLLAIVPRRVAALLVAQRPIKVVDLPIQVRGFAVMQYWHDRYHRDPALVWLRNTIFELVSGQRTSRTTAHV